MDDCSINYMCQCKTVMCTIGVNAGLYYGLYVSMKDCSMDFRCYCRTVVCIIYFPVGL